MNKNIKRTIAIIPIIGSLCTFVPLNYFNLMVTKKIYASEFNNNNITIELKDCTSELENNLLLKQNFNNRGSYEAVINKSIEKITFNFKVNKDNCKIKIQGETLTENSKKDCTYERNVILGKDKNIFNINVEQKNGVTNNYKAVIYQRDNITIKSTEDVKLKNIILNNGDIDFKLDKDSSYNYYCLNLDKSIKKLKIKVQPENVKDIVRINGEIIDSRFENEIYLDKNKKEIYIEVQDYKNEDSTNMYILNTQLVSNNWIVKNEKKYRYDFEGNLIRNSWYFEEKKCKDSWYYLESDGAAKKKWLLNNDKWYHFGENSIMNTEWEYINGIWYYFDKLGEMQTGWLNYNNNWYYMQSSGAMKTGWLNDNGTWYYMTSSGDVKTGWLKDNDNSWYYLNANGSMAKSTKVDGYILSSNGMWKK